MKPRYVHDCDVCKFLGQFDYDGPLSDGTTERCAADLYYCHSNGFLGGSVLARHSDEPSDYSSMPLDVMRSHVADMRRRPATHTPALLEAYDRHHAAGTQD